MMNGFMMWMSGSELNIFSIMITGMTIMGPLKAIADVNKTMKTDAPELAGELQRAKALYVLMNVVGLLVALYKCYSMGLLPTSTSDWVDSTPQVPLEFASGSFYP
eukprot:TRINITY_DN2240_c0_g1_i1.p3 TRINITY_DN2240_c0_g1~~TRINITY_DN2240_c0_g1_i1.p3  ORF type:complete len:105 (+),score=28.89 TRINITY_DN2240_c0_g1_i1:101-415(+)